MEKFPAGIPVATSAKVTPVSQHMNEDDLKKAPASATIGLQLYERAQAKNTYLSCHALEP